MTWPAESTRGARFGRPARPERGGLWRQSSRRRPLPLEATPTRPRAARAGVVTGVTAGVRAPRVPDFASTESPLRITRFTKSEERTSAATRTFRPTRVPRGMTACLPTTVIPVFRRSGLLLVRPVVERSVADDRTLADHDLLVEDRTVDDGPRADDRVEHHDRIADDRADPDPDSRRQHRVDDRPIDHAAVADQAAVDLGGRPDLGRGAFLGPGVDDPVLVVEVQLWVVGQQRHVGLPERLDRADVLPVAVVAIAEDPRSRVEHRGDDVGPEVDAILRQPAPQRLLREDVDAHRGEVALRLLGLLLPLGDAVVLVEGEDAHARGLGQGHAADRDGHVGALSAVGGDERLVVHLVDVVAREDERPCRPRRARSR